MITLEGMVTFVWSNIKLALNELARVPLGSKQVQNIIRGSTTADTIMPKWSGFAQLVWISRFSPPVVRLSPRSFFAVDTCTSRLQLCEITKGYGERKQSRKTSRCIKVSDVLEGV
jgi:hypothetical protein